MSWLKITCAEADALHRDRTLAIAAGFTDMDGEYGEPEIRRTWADKDTDALIVKDVRYPRGPKPCEHYAFEADE